MFAVACVVAVLLLAANVALAVWGRVRDPLAGAASQSFQGLGLSAEENQVRDEHWKRVCNWIQRATPPDALFLTPRHQQTFKWYAGRSEVVCGKDIPQDAAGIVEWHHRMSAVFPGWTGRYDLLAHGERGLLDLARRFGAAYVVVDRGVTTAGIESLVRVYPEGPGESNTFEVYQIPPQDEP
jgi:hypothetical protein